MSEASNSEEEDIGMRKGSKKSNVENTNKEVKWKSREEEDIKRTNCSRISNVETVNEEIKEISSEVEEIGRRKCRKRSRDDIMKKEILKYVSVGEEVELKLWMREWNYGHLHRNNKKLLQKYQIPKRRLVKNKRK